MYKSQEINIYSCQRSQVRPIIVQIIRKIRRSNLS